MRYILKVEKSGYFLSRSRHIPARRYLAVLIAVFAG
jgi:hypothetical protein